MFQHPGQATVARAFEDAPAGGGVKVAEQIAHFLAVVGVRLPLVAAGQARLQQRRLAFETAQGLAVAGAQGVGHRQAVLVEHVEQFDEERQVLHRAALDQGQDELAVFQADEEVAVLGAFGDATEIPQAAQVVGARKASRVERSSGVNTDMSARPRQVGNAHHQLKISHCGISLSGWSERMKLPSLPSARTRK